ncbi:hypothetical protein HPB50_014053 [Hyalomma asiaticum]|uniref:Uncharacterized protein n=1 Tax=Hyalomma asiaticum TaxID=266040 RepID=A0ACB7T8C4_HYAAI|nr:hypothetical protein HPB50_014053 [Hyalomma asiaticum]
MRGDMELHETSVDTFSCHECGTLFLKKYHMEVRVREHTGEKQYTCQVCGQSFIELYSCQRHMQTVHRDAELKDSSDMDGTQQTGSTETSRDDAVRDGESGTSDGSSEAPTKKRGCAVSRKYECSTCGRCFTASSALRQHRILHTGEKPYTCSTCGQKFSQNAGLFQHLRYHAGEKPFACELCPARFYRSQSLKNHQRQHRGGVEFHQCPTCHHLFKSVTALKEHQGWHVRQKPHQCHLCPISFMRKHELDRHILKHRLRGARQRPHACTLCSKRFALQNGLQVHMRQAHSGEETNAARADDTERPTLLGSLPSTPPPPVVDSVDIKVEPSSPATTPPPHSLDVGRTPLTSSTEISRDASIVDSEPGIPSGTSRAPAENCGNGAGSSDHVCEVCGRSLSTKAKLKRHELSHTGERPYPCSICDRRFALKSNLRVHERTHAKRGSLACKLCPFKASRRLMLAKHYELHKLYSCHVCPSTFMEKSELDDHMLIHAQDDQKPRTCPITVAVRAEFSAAPAHRTCKDLPAETATRTCSFDEKLGQQAKQFKQFRSSRESAAADCPQLSSCASSVRRSFDGTLGDPMEKHGQRSAGSLHKCSICGKHFSSKQYLDSHQVLHTGDKPYACPVCGRKFAQRSSFVYHRCTHSNVMPYACELCPSKFCKKESLNRHKLLHSCGVDLYHCDECGKGFKSRTVLEKHQLWHKGGKPFPCHLCPATFVYSKDLDRHSLVHTGERPHICPVCKKTFSWKKNLKSHMHRIHSADMPSVAGVSGMKVLTSPSSPPSTMPPVMDSVHIKVEPSSPATTPPPKLKESSFQDMSCGDIEEEFTTPNSPTPCSVSFHGFPRNPEHRTRWTTAIKRKEGPEFIITSNTKVCSKHFNACDYLPHVVSGRHILRETAVPSVFPLTLTEKEKKPRKEQGLLAILMENWQAESHPGLQQHEAEVSGSGGVACLRDMVLPEEDWEAPSGQETTKGPPSTSGEELPEPAVLLPRIVSIMSLSSGTEASEDLATMNDDQRASDGSAGSPLKKHARDVGTYHECGVCGRRFTERWSLKDHQLSHTEEKKHACPICGRKFTLKADVTRHLHVHTSELRYACPRCPSRFRKKASLDAHEQLHLSGVELFYCHECNKNFKQMNTLQQHLKWHKKRKSYMCHLCPAAFPYRDALARHRLVHTGQRPHVCPVCQRGFTWKNNLKAHMRLLHYGVKTAMQGAADSVVEITMPSSSLGMLPPGWDFDGSRGILTGSMGHVNKMLKSKSNRRLMCSVILGVVGLVLLGYTLASRATRQ